MGFLMGFHQIYWDFTDLYRRIYYGIYHDLIRIHADQGSTSAINHHTVSKHLGIFMNSIMKKLDKLTIANRKPYPRKYGWEHHFLHSYA